MIIVEGIARYFNQTFEKDYTEFEYEAVHVVITKQIHKGISAACNKGLAIAKGNYILFVDQMMNFIRAVKNAILEINYKKANMVIFSFESIYLNDDNTVKSKQTVMLMMSII